MHPFRDTKVLRPILSPGADLAGGFNFNNYAKCPLRGRAAAPQLTNGAGGVSLARGCAGLGTVTVIMNDSNRAFRVGLRYPS